MSAEFQASLRYVIAWQRNYGHTQLASYHQRKWCSLDGVTVSQFVVQSVESVTISRSKTIVFISIGDH